MNKVKRQKFPHGTYHIIWRKPRKAHGMCGSPNEKKIWLNPNLKGKKFLQVILDESIHAGAWNLDNDWVGAMSADMADFLWKIGFRLVKNCKSI